MTLSTGLSCFMAALMSIMTIASMNLFADVLSSSKGFTILGGFVGSVLCVLLITAVNNAECLIFGEGFQSGLFPEVLLCLSISVIASGLIHGVCGTTCVLFSIYAIFCLHQWSQESKHTATLTANVHLKKKRN